MNNRKNGFLLLLIGLVIFFIFEGSNIGFVGGFLVVVGLGMIMKPPETPQLRIYENPKTTKNLRHWGYYKTIHFSKLRKRKRKDKFRVVLRAATGEEYAFLMPEIPPRKFFWVNGKCITPEKAKEIKEKSKAKNIA